MEEKSCNKCKWKEAPCCDCIATGTKADFEDGECIECKIIKLQSQLSASEAKVKDYDKFEKKCEALEKEIVQLKKPVSVHDVEEYYKDE